MRKIATIIAHKNYLDYLKKAVDSAKNQTYRNTICVIDDGSDYEQDEIIKAVFDNKTPDFVRTVTEEITAVSYDNIHLFLSSKSYGPSRARNIGIAALIKEVEAFMILDADDQMYPNKIERLVSEMEKDWKNIGIVYADYLIDKGDYRVMEFKKPYDKELLKQECIIHSGSLINADVFRKVGLYDESFRVCEDYDLWLRACQHFLAIHVPEPLTLVLDHKNNSTNTVNNNIWQESWLRLRKKHENIYS